MDKPLWAVKVSFEMVVCAWDEEDAEEIATQNAALASQSESSFPTVAIRPVRTSEELPDGWQDAYPWGDSDFQTCAEMLR